MNKLKTIFKDNWKIILFSYILSTLNSVFMIIYPKVLGNSIDHLIAKDYTYVTYLFLTFSGFMFFGYISRIYDTKVFSSIYRKFASVETDKQFEDGVDSGKINGRLGLMNYIISFFERDVILMLNSIYGIIGSLYFVFLVDKTMVLFLFLSAVATIGVTYYYSPKIGAINKEFNNLSEDQTKVVNERKINLVNNLLRKRQKLSIGLSNLDAKFSVLIQIIAYGTVTSILTYYVVFNQVTVGSAFSTYRYLFDFCISVSYIPIIVTSFVNIKDVIKRLETE